MARCGCGFVTKGAKGKLGTKLSSCPRHRRIRLGTKAAKKGTRKVRIS
jgi:hypothetical protein